jgi:hypothetical protein
MQPHLGLRRRTTPDLSAKDIECSPDPLIDAAVALFAECGYVDTTMDQVAERAGVSARMLYSRFNNKSELLEALARRDARIPRIAVWVTIVSMIVPVLFGALLGI